MLRYYIDGSSQAAIADVPTVFLGLLQSGSGSGLPEDLSTLDMSGRQDRSLKPGDPGIGVRGRG